MRARIFMPVAAAAAAFLIALSNAQAQGVCATLFPQGSASSSISASSYSGIISITFLIIIAVLVSLGIVYALGMTFGIDSFKRFVKREYLEQFVNLVLLVAIAGGMAFAGNAIAAVSNVALVSLSPSASPASNSSFSTFSQLCSTYGSVASYLMAGYLSLQLPLLVTNLFNLASISVSPGPFLTITLQPLQGSYIFIQTINTELGVYGAMAGLSLAVMFLLFLIYTIFPLFLYLGVLFRSIPFTRSIGGSLISLFICFYIIFPAILAPINVATPYLFQDLQQANINVCSAFNSTPEFSQFCSSNPDQNISEFSSSAALSSSSITSLVSDTILASRSNIGTLLGSFITLNPTPLIESFVSAVSIWMLQILAIILAFFISFDLLEYLSTLLGAESMRGRSKDLFKKLI